LSSDGFRRSPKLSRLLGYLCDKQLNGRADEITEYAIALEALGRTAQFDPQQDAVVRVDLHHLRKRLKEYYTGVGSDHQIEIVIPNGQYAPRFVLRGRTAPLPPEQTAPGTPEPTPAWAKPALNNRKWIAALVLAALPITWVAQHYRQSISDLMVSRAGPGPSDSALGRGTAESEEVRISAGDRKTAYVDAAGRAWLPDQYFTGGTAFRRPGIPIQRTHDPDLFQNGREGQFVYAIPLRNG
jgi:hypothetical protein